MITVSALTFTLMVLLIIHQLIILYKCAVMKTSFIFTFICTFLLQTNKQTIALDDDPREVLKYSPRYLGKSVSFSVST